MAGSGAGEKTEKATPKRKKDERKKGNVFSSKDFEAAFFILSVFFVLRIFSEKMFFTLGNCLTNFIKMSGEITEFNNENVMMILRQGIKTFLLVLAPIFIVSVLVPFVLTGVQTKFVFSMSAIKPKFSRLNPIEGIKKLFSLRNIVELVKSLLKLAVIAAIIINNIKKRIYDIINLMDVDVKEAVVYLASAIYSTVITIAVIFVFLGIADYFYQWWEYEKNLKMTKQEVKEEYKQMEGDPEIKGKIKQKQREMANARMMADVPTADVIIRNPTHYAIAVRYDIDKDIAPIVIAKGVDILALKIIEIATENNIIMQENKPLARALYKEVEVGQSIPAEFYEEVAEILAFVYNLKQKKLT